MLEDPSLQPQRGMLTTPAIGGARQALQVEQQAPSQIPIGAQELVNNLYQWRDALPSMGKEPSNPEEAVARNSLLQKIGSIKNAPRELKTEMARIMGKEPLTELIVDDVDFQQKLRSGDPNVQSEAEAKLRSYIADLYFTPGVIIPEGLPIGLAAKLAASPVNKWDSVIVDPWYCFETMHKPMQDRHQSDLASVRGVPQNSKSMLGLQRKENGILTDYSRYQHSKNASKPDHEKLDRMKNDIIQEQEQLFGSL